MIGQTISHYKITDKLGQGGMGVVYKAEDTKLHRPVALKFLSSPALADDERRKRFFLEARAAASLDHPNICVVHEVDEVDGMPFIAMGFVDGESVEQRIATGSVSFPEAVHIASEIAAGLQEAHSKGVVHRDIKPANVMLSLEGRVKITDFGLAHLIGTERLTRSGSTVGTIAYMAPEQVQAEEIDHRADIWALGVVLYELVTGKLPFRGAYEQAILYSILNEEPEWLTATDPAAPPGWTEFVKRALAKGAEERHESAQEFRRDVQALAPGGSGTIIVASPPALTERDSVELGARPAATATPSGQHVVGRSQERALLARAFDSAVSGIGRVACIAGEPGIGKTTLIQDFLTGLRGGSRKYFLSTGKCSERLAGTEAYLPVIEALEHLCRADPTRRASALLKRTAPTWYLQVAPVAAASDPALTGVLSDAKVASQERMKREMYAFLRELSAIGPVVLFLDDLHWADPSTVDLLSYIGHRCESARLLIVGAYRPSDLLLAQHPFLQVKQELQGRGVCQEVELGFLGREEIERYLSLQFPGNDFPAEFVELVESRTEGSPLFMVDVLRDERARGAITKQNGGWTLSKTVSSIGRGMPESIRGMIERKISRLEPRDRELLTTACVQGQEFDSATVGAAAEIDPTEVEERLAEVARLHRFVRVTEEAEFHDSTLTTKYSFVHALYHNALFETLRQRERISLSAKVADALLGFHGDQSHEVASELAYLLETARRWEQAADHFLLAADNAAKVYANEEAVALSHKALEQAKRLPDGPRRQRVLEATFKLAQVHLTTSDLEAAGADFRLAAQVAEEAGRPEAQIDAICGAALTEFNLKRTDNTRVLGERALEVARAAHSAYGTASAEAVLAMELISRGDIRGSSELVARAGPVLMTADRRPTPMHVIEAVQHCAAHKGWQGKFEEAAPGAQWAMERALEREVPYHVIMCLFSGGVGMGQFGQISAAIESLEKAMRLAELSGERFWLPRATNTLGWIYREAQDFETALKVCATGTQMGREGFQEGPAHAHVHLAGIHLTLRENERAHEHLLKARSKLDEDPWFRWVYEVRYQWELARYWVAVGDLPAAKTQIESQLSLARKALRNKFIARGEQVLGDIASLEDKPDVAQVHYESALNLVKAYPCPTVEWTILSDLARNCRARKDSARADELLARARSVTQGLADSITDPGLQVTFLESEAVQSLG
jgi:tetratricopeptide (TPR) repeat protein/tRNA A-37 threonylcarbamoyl transferase component Bud32